MLPDLCGSRLLLSLPDDIFSVITSSLSPSDVCSLGLACRDLNAVVSSDKVWLAQCSKLGIKLLPLSTLVEWRKGVLSYRALCRFLIDVHPLIGIWVHQNPELGNVVYVMPGFLSLVGCRIIPQEVGPLGLEEGPILWTPVFEIICNHVGSASFFLHGRERGDDYVYPGLLKNSSADKNCNVLLLEVEPRHQSEGGKLTYSKSFARELDNEVSLSNKLSRSCSGRVSNSKSQKMPFSRLGFGDRRRLLDVVTSQIRNIVPKEANVMLFPRSKNDFGVLYERRLLLLQMYDEESSSPFNPTELGSSDVCKSLECTTTTTSVDQCHVTKSKTLSGFLKNGLKHILRKSSVDQESQKSTSSSSRCQSKLHEFLRSGDRVGLSLRAATMKLSSYRAWPNMHDSRFALYKLPLHPSNACDEYAGLWGATFGWPPGRKSEEKPGKALFLILISYEESEGEKLMIGTKILEGTSYVLHPNGSAMFIVNVNQPSMELFPIESDGESNYIEVKRSFSGEGVANGYGFRYPGSKPGSLFVLENGLLVFMWKESRVVLTLQRLDLGELLRKGERVNSLSPISNFAYLTKTYSNVYSGF
ncbi:hypothetical protein ABFS82_12G038200 [Erythranthe guttata]|uniref:F-box domain-containing protein n=1 Tax=Erythranthe guttata TaxID=4155 RepID=A0A022QVG6_ERYGU|nr:PREDICTED: F-box protein At5g39450-like [Erythranthe guttata]EYU31554.1 hypothetical protein MIMGU_mgv1a003416mg [Erythranthe guttata]|eukprot:XP_012844428.1 PREDICTED: F-box protein At5g39450-like [Erythranthe guttata]